MQYQDTRKLLGRFGLAGHAHTIKIKDLSGTFRSSFTFFVYTGYDRKNELNRFQQPRSLIDLFVQWLRLASNFVSLVFKSEIV